MIKLSFLGTGTSQGVPVIACKCPVCLSENKKDKRLRSSVLIQIEDQNIVIDSGPDFRYQMLRAKVDHLSAILFTHEHKDHTAGLDDIRAFNWVNKKAVNIYAEKRVQESLKREFSYVFADEKYPGIPEMNLIKIENKPFKLKQIDIFPIRAMHLDLPIYGYRIEDLVYITDANFIANEEKEKIKGAKVLIVNALGTKKHISHYCLSEALELVKEVQPQKAYFTHISHQMGFHEEVQKLLPEHVYLAYDGLNIEV